MHRHAACALLLIPLALCGLVSCRMAGAIGANATQLVTTPRAVPDKVTDPRRPDARIAVLWVGHATVLVQMDDKFVMTDPVFTSAVGEVSRRMVEPGIDVANVPPLDVVVISHMHFDHLSYGSLDLLEPKVKELLVPEQGIVYVPNYRFPSQEVSRWASVDVGGGLVVTSVPVDHLGFRYGVDMEWMTRSFGGWVFAYHGLTVYFGGDTAYDAKDFAATRARFPHIDVALLPIAPVEPRDFMKRVHMDGREAVQAFLDLGARVMVPIHYDTFVNSADAPGHALEVLREGMRAHGVGEDRVQIVAVGEERTLVPR